MKETYTAPVMEVIEFDAEDVITTSPTNGGTYTPDNELEWSEFEPVG